MYFGDVYRKDIGQILSGQKGNVALSNPYVRQIIENVLLTLGIEYFQVKNYHKRLWATIEVQTHAYGHKEGVKRLIDCNFNNEDEYIRRYRLQVTEIVTIPNFSKIVDILSAIRQSDEFDVHVNEGYEDREAEINACINFVFSKLCKILASPTGYIVKMGDVWKVFDVEEIVSESDTALIIYDKYFNYYIISADAYYIVEPEYNDYNSVIMYGEVGHVNGFVKDNLIGEPIIKKYDVPCKWVRIKGADMNGFEPTPLYCIIPCFNQVIVQQSEKQAGIKQHMYPEKWKYAGNKCNVCKGEGMVRIPADIANLTDIKNAQVCSVCKGSGHAPRGTFSETIIDTTIGSFMEKDLKMPPAGYIEKDYRPIEFLKEDIEANTFMALAGINLEFLFKTPVVQSGFAKNIDRSVVSATLTKYARLIVEDYIMPFVGLSASITIPKHFDQIIPVDFREEQTSEIRKIMIQKRIGNDYNPNEDIVKPVILQFQIDPVSGLSISEKQAYFDMGVFDKIDMFLNANFVTCYDLLLKSYDFSGTKNEIKQKMREVAKSIMLSESKETETIIAPTAKESQTSNQTNQTNQTNKTT